MPTYCIKLYKINVHTIQFILFFFSLLHSTHLTFWNLRFSGLRLAAHQSNTTHDMICDPDFALLSHFKYWSVANRFRTIIEICS